MRYPKLVDTAWDVVEQLVRDWQECPYDFEMVSLAKG